jgi:Protein of unknown function (DUF4012)
MMKFLKKLVDKSWKIILLIVTALLGILTIYLCLTVIPIISDAKAYIAGIQEGVSSRSIEKKSEILNKDLDNIFTQLNKPFIKQIVSTAGLDFSTIKPELKSLITSGPDLAGIRTPQKYLLAFQNSAEARGTGGILGAYAIVIINKGKLNVERTGSNIALKSLNEIPILVPDEYKQLYRSDPAIWQNSNLSPHFPYAARIWMALWERQYHEKLDGVIAIDPTALSYILKATGPIRLPSSEKVNSNNVVYKVLSEAYKRFEFENIARKQYLVEIMNATFAKITVGSFSKITMATALKRSIEENRILVYTNNSSVEKNIAQSVLAGDLSTNAKNQYRVVIQNIDASKLDYYLDRKISVKSLTCGDVRTTQISVKVTNSLKTGAGLPAYVLTRADKTKPIGLFTGQHRFLVFIYGPRGATLLNAHRSSSFGSAGGVGTELERPILVSDVDLSPQKSETITAIFSGGHGVVTFHDQPLVRKSSISISNSCKG